MKNLFCFFEAKLVMGLIIVGLTTPILSGTHTIEVQDFDTVEQEIADSIASTDPDSILVVFDLDHTLVLIQDCIDDADTVPSFIQFLNDLQHCEADLTSPRIPDFFKELSNQSVSIIGLTARHHKYSDVSAHEIDRHGLVFGEGMGDDFEHFYKPTKKWIFKNGITYAGGKAKGPVLKILLDKFSQNPIKRTFKKVIFVDDNEKNIKSVNAAFRKSTDHDVKVIHYTEYNK